MLFYLFLVLINAGFAVIVANAAKEKGYTPVGFWFLSFFTSFVVGIIVVSIIKDKNKDTNSAVKADESTIALKDNFVGKYLVFLVLFIVLSLTLSRFNDIGISGITRRMDSLYKTFSYIGILALAVVVSTRAKGPDLSITATMGLSSMVFALAAQVNGLVYGAIISLIVCLVIGILHGLVIVYLKAPAIIITLVTSTIITGLTLVLSNGRTVGINLYNLPDSILFILIAILVVLVITILLLLLTKLGKPMAQRTEKDTNSFSFFAGYIASSAFAGISGMIYAVRLNAASPLAGNGMLIYILIFFAIISSSRLYQKKIVTPLVALCAAFILSFLNIVMSITGTNVFIQNITFGIITLAFVITMAVARKKEFKYSLDSV